MIEAQLADLLNHVANTKEPIQIKASVPYTIFDNYEKKHLQRENSFMFANNAFIAKFGMPDENT